MSSETELRRRIAVLEDALARAQALLERRNSSDAIAAGLPDALPIFTAFIDQEQRYRLINRTYEAWLGRPRDEILGATMAEMLAPEVYEPRRPFVEAALRGEASVFDLTMPGEDGRLAYIRTRYLPRRAEDGTVLGFYLLVEDISEMKRREANQTLLIHELNHRVKNTLATVQALAQQTLRGAADAGQAQMALESRFIALASAHDILTQERWSGAQLAAVVERVLQPFRDARADQVTVEGVEVRIAPAPALSLALALHELSTNATKYGALSTPEGRVKLTWTAEPVPDGVRLALHWAESGGPPVAPPTRRGFGARLLERALGHDLSGRVRLTYAPEGVVCTVEANLAAPREDPGIVRLP